MNLKDNSPIFLSFFLSTIAPMSLGIIISILLPDWRWSHYPFHAMVETMGAFSAVTVATLMILMVKNEHLDKHFIIVACALIGMGILDGFHAVLHAGTSFVWLHSIATLVGGGIFAMVWIPDNRIKDIWRPRMIYITGLASLILGLLSIALPGSLPAMVVDGEFTLTAKAINIMGGLGFLMGSGYFVRHYIRTSRDAYQETRVQDLVFANHCLLFGIAGLLFEFSILWDAGWWWWHILRLLAYMVVLVYMFSQFSLAQQKLTEYTVQLEHLNQAKSLFLANMSHELRTPMHAIMSFTNLCLKRVEDEKSNRFLQNIQSSASRLTSLLNNLLDLAKLESGKVEVSYGQYDIREIVNSCATYLESLFNEKKLVLKINREEPVVGEFDEDLMYQVVTNLLSNAIKFSHEGATIRVEINTANSVLNGRPQESIHLSVIDQGVGIPEDELESVFDKFVQSSKTDNKSGGTGLGLPICKEIINEHQGLIKAVSPPGGESQGTCIELIIPSRQGVVASGTTG